MRQLPTAAEAATLLAVCVKRKEDESSREFSHLRTSEKTFQRLTGRRRLDGRFIADLNESLLDFNLLAVLTGDAIGLIKASAVRGWPRMNSARMSDEIRDARHGALDFDDLLRELDGGPSGFDEDGDEEL